MCKLVCTHVGAKVYIHVHKHVYMLANSPGLAAVDAHIDIYVDADDV